MRLKSVAVGALIAALALSVVPVQAAGDTIETLAARVAALECRVQVLEGGEPCPTPTPSESPAPTPSAVVSASPSATPSPVPTSTPAPTPTPSAAPTGTPAPTATPSGTQTVTLEAQAWWNRDGIQTPEAPGHHIHVSATIPRPGVIVNGRVDVPVTITLHDQVSGPTWIRWSDGSTVKGSIALDGFNGFACTTHDGFTDCKRSVVLPIDFGGFGTGLRELRISVNVPDEQPDVAGSQRMFNSTGWPVAVRALSPIAEGGRSVNFIEARGWYTDHEYQNARLTTGIPSVRAGGTIGVKLAPGSGGIATTYSLVTLDPDMHRHLIGRVLLERNGAFSGSVVIPADLAPGTHKLTLLASDGKDAGVLVIPFVVQ